MLMSTPNCFYGQILVLKTKYGSKDEYLNCINVLKQNEIESEENIKKVEGKPEKSNLEARQTNAK